ncbi:DUF5331 domain-containing protein [Synechocystis sp. CACIAM 05]|jgi:hypothetical protein|uniref:DUF5331 domain-containing protein n=1 Tax=Synechocystis sp. CACIAM 05 TaxID=1933929 RepID=UPI00138E7621|nr:DUF5331 domain-containing protein [Synechocystis sp. CACIAM 05]QHV01439.1 hypothetical protein BWK47_15740 [Synechocystis sp. CACIAM 05]
MIKTEEFEELKVKLNDRWLDYYEIHNSWIKKTLPSNNNGYLDQKTLCCFALGVISAFEPELKDTLKYFSELNPDPQVLAKVLGIETLIIHEKIKERKKKMDCPTKKESGDSEYAEASKHLEEIRQSSNSA